MVYIKYILSMMSLYMCVVGLSWASSEEVTINVNVCNPNMSVSLWGGLVFITIFVFFIGKSLITPMLLERVARLHKEDPTPYLKKAKVQGMGVTAILTAITLVSVSILLLGCLPTSLLIFSVLCFIVIFTYGFLLL